MDKRTLQKLQDDVDAASAAVEQAQEVLTAARQAWWNAEREMRRSAKLTPAMRTALEQILAGGVLRENSFNHPYRYFISPLEGNSITIRSTVFDGLRSREMIGAEIRDGVCMRRFELTDHGRTAAKEVSK